MMRKCPRCLRPAKSVARFCARCGLSLDPGSDGTLTPGRLRHPAALPPPPEFKSCAGAVDLYYHWESVSGGPCMGAEPLAVQFFNGGYSLSAAVLQLLGRDGKNAAVFRLEQTITELPRGTHVRIEVPSYEVAREVTAVDATLESAQFAPHE